MTPPGQHVLSVLVVALNEALELPDFLSGLEVTIRRLEDQAAATTEVPGSVDDCHEPVRPTRARTRAPPAATIRARRSGPPATCTESPAGVCGTSTGVIFRSAAIVQAISWSSARPATSQPSAIVAIACALVVVAVLGSSTWARAKSRL